MNNLAPISRSVCLSGYFALMITILLWNAWLSIPEVPVAIVLSILLSPLLFALKGLLNDIPYTYAWSSLLALFYFVLGVSDAYSDPMDRIYGIIVIITSLMFFSGAVLYVRFRPKP